MASSNYIYEPTVGRQNADNTVFNYVANYDAINNATVTGNTYKYKSDRERMQALIGSRGQSRNSGYFSGLYMRFYSISVTDPTLPGNTGPPNSGWGTEIGTPGPYTVMQFDNSFFQQKCNLQFYVGATLRGYIYSPVATTIEVRTTSDDGSIVYLNGSLIVNNWAYQGATTVTSAVTQLNAGYTPINIYYFNGAVTASLNVEVKIGNGPFTSDLSCIACYNYAQL